MVELTVSCSCGRTMRPNYRAGPHHYRCGCGVQITIGGVPTRATNACPILKEGRLCGRRKTSGADVCDQCAEWICRIALSRRDMAERLATITAYTEFQQKQGVARQHYHREHNEWLDRIREEGQMTDYNLVYYVLTRPGIVKIGTTRQLKARMSNLRLDPDDVLAAEPGTQKLENVRHRQFADLRTGRYREDFTLDDRLRAHIDAVREKHGDPFELGREMGKRRNADARSRLAPPASQSYLQARSDESSSSTAGSAA